MRKFVLAVLLMLAAQPAAAADVASIATQVVGAWRLDFTTPDFARRTPTVLVGRQGDELLAWYWEYGEPEAFRDVRIAGDSLRLVIVPRERGGEATVALEAKLDGPGKCLGRADYTLTGGESGSWEFAGRKLAMSELNPHSRWDLSFATPDGERHAATVNVFARNGKPYGWYSGRDHALLANSLAVDGDRVSLALATKVRGGSTVDVTFRGTVAGDTVQGTADFVLNRETGSFPFSGQRKRD